MRSFALLPFALSLVQAVPQDSGLFNNVQTVFQKSQKLTQKWVDEGKEWIQSGDQVFEYVSHPDFGNHHLRVTEPKLCDPSVKQYSGYFDIAEDKHLFFWFFEAREQPKTAPLTMWLNGGPGCSSSTGLLFELGPCQVTDNGSNTTYNPYSWNKNTNLIFLDQPVNVGFSYASDGQTVNTSPVAGKDVYAFMELFLARFPQYAKAPFHLAAESYGGTYAPNIATAIHEGNKALALAPTPNLVKVNLASVILANGLTDPYIQYASIPDWACDGPYPVLEGAQCTAMRSKVPTCQRLIQSCYNSGSRFACVGAALYCNAQLMGPLQNLGKNPYDARRKCDHDVDGPLCYRQMGWIETWMNTKSNQIALGVDPDLKFESCNMKVNQAFMFQGDGMHNSAALLPALINDGIRLLVYAGNADMMCNFIGNERWMDALDHRFHKEFQVSKSLPWVVEKSGRVAGVVRSAGGKGAGNVTYVNVHEAGHMVPYDQPEAALDLFNRWISNEPLTVQ